jgi:hypothetical protein
MPYTTKTSRSSPVTSPKALSRIESADGSRWAYSRARKVCSANGTYVIVQSWVCKARVNGKAVTVNADAYESAAIEFVNQGATS